MPDTEGELIDETDSALQKSADASFSSDTPEGWAVCGTCMWNIDSDGALVIKPIDGVSGELESGVAPWLEQKDDIKSVLVEKGVSAGKSVSGFLQGCANATCIDLRGLGTSQTEDFSSMLKGCSSLTVLDVTGLDTSNASTLDEFFSDCEVLSFLDISSFDMKNVASMSWMFEGCHSLKTVKTGKGFSLSGRDSEGGCVMFASSNWTEYSGLWISDRDGKAYDCARVPEGIAATYTAQKWSDNKAPNRCGTCVWNVDEQGVLTIKPMGDMGEGALAEQGQGDYAAWSSKQGEIKSIKVEGKVVAPRKMDGMFSGYSNLEHADLRGFDTIVNASTMSRLFSGCASLESLDLSTFITIYCWGMGDMFSGCPSLRKIALGSGFSFKGADGDDRKCSFPKLDADGLTGYWQNEAGETFREDEIPSFKNATYTAQEGERALDWKTSGTCKWAIDDGMLVIKPANGISGEFEEWKGTYDEPDTPWREKASEITSVKVESGVVAPSSIWGMFVGCSSLVSADLKELDAASVSDIGLMFRGCSSLNSIEFPENGMPRVNDVQDAFCDCASLESIDLSFLKGAVIQGNMEGMFYGCSDLRSVNLSGLDTSKATGMANLFRGCSSLESVELSGMDTSAATSMNCMFRDCANLTSLDLSSFRTDQLVEMNRMFEGCSSLAYLNLSSFDTSKLSCVENRSGMVSVFSGCASLKTVVLGENFTFNGSGTERQCSLPTPRKGGLEGKWQDAKGQVFVPSEVPDGAGTYTAVFPDIPDGWNVCGTCVWGVEGGKLVIKPIDGESGELAEWGDGGKAPWEEEHSYRQVAEASKVVVEGHVVAPVNAHGMFSGLPNVEKIDLSGLDTSRTTNMMQMFAGSSAKTIDVSGFDTSNVTNMKWMFLNCCNLESLDLSSFDTSKVSDAWGWIGTPGTRWSLAEITLGDKFDFKGNGDMRGSSTGGEPLQSHTFGGIMTPETIVDGKDASPYTGFWVDAATGKCYSNREELPSKTTATYRAQRNLLESDFSVDVSDAVYSGEAVACHVGSDSLTKGVDYDVAYSNNTNAGTASVSIVGKGLYASELNYTFKILPAAITADMVSGIPEKMKATSGQLTPEPTVTFNGKTLAKGKDYTVSYGDNTEPGKGTVTVTAVEGGNFTCSATVEFNIEKKAEQSANDIGNGRYSYVITSGSYHSGVEGYTGKPISPTLAVCTWRSGDDQLREGVDYVFRGWRDAGHRDLDGAPTEIGTYYVVFDGVGDYAGTLEGELRIVDPADIGSGLYTAWESGGYGNGDDVLYTGEAVDPDMSVERDDTGDRLEEGVDFEVEGYLDADGNALDGAPDAVGSYTAVLAGKGSYAGKLERTIYVRPRNSLHFARFSFYRKMFAYTGEPIDLGLKVTSLDGDELQEGVDYRIEYYRAYDWGDASTSAPSEVGDYTVTVEAIDGGGCVDSVSWIHASIKDVTDIGDAGLTVKPVTYTGSSNLFLDVRDQAANDYLSEGDDYEVKGYLDADGNALDGVPTSVGRYSAVLEGRGFYKGEASFPFEIMPAMLADCRVSGIPEAMTYSGSQLTPKPMLAYWTWLAEGTDYDVSYGDNVNAGECTVVITGKGNYAGQVTCTFRIDPKQVDAPEAAADLVYSGAEQVGVAPSVEYEVSNGSATNAGSYTATVSLKDKKNYIWSGKDSSNDLKVPWSITKATPSYTRPAAINATEGQTLGDLELPDGFSWQDDLSTGVGDAGEREFMVTFTPEDTGNYNVVGKIPVKVNVSKGVDGWNAVGDCMWRVDDQGCLVIKPANGVSGTLENFTTLVENDAGNLRRKAPWEDYSDEITSARFEKGVVAGADLGCIFWQLCKLERVDFSSLDMSGVTNMGDAFRCCESLKEVDGLGAEGGMALEDATEMFSLCRSLKAVDLNNVDLSGLDSAGWMFSDCRALEELNLSDLGSKSSQYRYLSGMLYGCSSLERVDLSGLDTRGVRSMRDMFSGCTSLKYVKLGENFSFCGAGPERLCSLPAPWEDGATGLWRDAEGQTFAPSEVPDGAGTYTAVFLELSGGWRAIGGCAWKIDDRGYLIIKPTNGVSGELAEWSFDYDSGKASTPWRERAAEITSVVIEDGVIEPSDAWGMFEGCSNLVSADLRRLVVPGASNLRSMFAGCSSLKTLALPERGVPQVDDLRYAFMDCSSLESVDLSAFKGSTAWNSMAGAFLGCTSLKSIDLSGLDTSKVANMDDLFAGCSSLESVLLSGVNTLSVNTMKRMFDGCAFLENVTLGESFSFCGSGTERQCSLPTPSGELHTGKWVDVETGEVYSAAGVPDGKAATYRAQRRLLESDFAVDVSDAVYSGEAVGGRVSSSTLKEGADYDVAYFDNVDAGIAAIAVTGKGSYTGALSYTFEIDPAEMTDGMVSGVPSKKEATGSQLTPEPTVKFNGKTLEKGKDYTVAYGENKEPGKGTVTVAAIEGGNFTGSATVEFVIEKKAEPDPGTGGGGTDPAPTPDPGTGGGSGGGGDAPAPAPAPQQFAVTFHLDGGVNAASNPATYAAGTAAALADPTKEGFEFQGWYADAGFKNRVTEIAADSTGDVELWAKWRKEEEQKPAPTFPDVDNSESSWYGKAVTYVAEKGLITGYTSGDKAGMFGVGDTLTRAQLATILWRNACPDEAASYDAASSKDSTGIAGSADGQYYTAAANWAVKNGVISGYERPDGTKDFAADDDVSFEQLVTILARLCATPEELAAAGSDLSAFADGGDASAWSRAAFAWAAGKGLVRGYDTASGKLLSPGEDVARERVAVVLMRAFEMGILK